MCRSLTREVCGETWLRGRIDDGALDADDGSQVVSIDSQWPHYKETLKESREEVWQGREGETGVQVAVVVVVRRDGDGDLAVADRISSPCSGLSIFSTNAATGVHARSRLIGASTVLYWGRQYTKRISMSVTVILNCR